MEGGRSSWGGATVSGALWCCTAPGGEGARGQEHSAAVRLPVMSKRRANRKFPGMGRRSSVGPTYK